MHNFLYIAFKTWLTSLGGGGKSHSQADQLSVKVLKYLRYCCKDVNPTWDIPVNILDYCIGSINMLSDFIEHLQEEWKMGYSGIIGYLISIGHALDYRRCSKKPDNISVFIASEIYLNRVKKCLSKKQRVQWRTVLSAEYFNSINCWATLEELQKVIPYHSDKVKKAHASLLSKFRQINLVMKHVIRKNLIPFFPSISLIN